MTNIEITKQYVGKRGFADNPQYQDSMVNLRFDVFSEEDVIYFKKLYETVKDIFTRNQILQAFVLKCLQYDLKDFFLSAFKKERYLDMKLTAIRGYAAYANEQEVTSLMRKYSELLAKRPQTTPYNYQEYEMLRSEFGLPYLVKQYHYACFQQAERQLQKQYDEMPDLCKGFFTLNDQGLHVSLLSNEEIRERLDKLLEEQLSGGNE